MKNECRHQWRRLTVNRQKLEQGRESAGSVRVHRCGHRERHGEWGCAEHGLRGSNGREKKANRSRALPAPQKNVAVSYETVMLISPHTFWIHHFKSHRKISPIGLSSRLPPESGHMVCVSSTNNVLSTELFRSWRMSECWQECLPTSIHLPLSATKQKFTTHLLGRFTDSPDLLLHKLHILTKKEFMRNQAVNSHTTLNAPDFIWTRKHLVRTRVEYKSCRRPQQWLAELRPGYTETDYLLVWEGHVQLQGGIAAS